MTPKEIPATEQLMDLATEPPVPRDMLFVFQGLIWPTSDALKNQEAKTALSDAALRDDTMHWIRLILKPAWIAPDLPSRLLAAHTIAGGQDAFLARYEMNEKKIQIIVTRFHLHVVIAPATTQPPLAIHKYLNVDRADDASPWTGDPWNTSRVAGLDFGYMPRATVFDWRESIYYLTNGRSLKLSIRKLSESPRGSTPPKSVDFPPEEAERHWF